ncbi:hypothetical protein [Actinoplanes sp. NBRC 101535]|uniref:hypothetical protein n=1 Tax=Actinoplanes sp. NBRC 101535 TaxID=3032196 RepID=UPI002556C580|nr:hypothetical protein [Actinoplanes sp. NBRC 101535]
MATADADLIAVTLRVRDWLSLMGVMDNAISDAVEDGDPDDIVPIADRVRTAAGSSAYETNDRQLPHDQLTRVGLSSSDWRFTLRTLAEWAEAAEDVAPDPDPDLRGPSERELISGITVQLPAAFAPPA